MNRSTRPISTLSPQRVSRGRLRVAGFIALLSLLPGRAVPNTIDQSQGLVDSCMDNAACDCSGQTFVAGVDGYLTTIRVAVSGDKWPGSFPYGSDQRIRLRRVTPSGIPAADAVATGEFSRAVVSLNATNWISVELKPPYRQTRGESLCFMLEGLSGGGSNGWNNFGVSMSNAYTNGHRFTYMQIGNSTNYFPASNDMAFQTVVTTGPEIAVVSVEGGVLSMGVFSVSTGNVYSLEAASNITDEAWVTLGSSNAWNIIMGESESHFFRLRISGPIPIEAPR